MKSVLLAQPSLQPPGGGNGVAAWMIEGLKQDYQISVLAWRPVELEPINRYFGTSLEPSDFTVLLPPNWLRRLMNAGPASLSQIKTSILLRWCQRIKDQYHVIITVNNEADFGRRGIQYIHFPWMYQPRPKADLRWYHGIQLFVTAYYRLCIGVGNFSFERMKQNMTLVNSDWTGRKVRERHGIESVTLYPPVPGEFPQMPWEERKDAFVCIGRISPEKELEKILEILTRVRQQGHDIQLHLIGSPNDDSYTSWIRLLVQANANWAELHENLSRDELVQLVASCRYGIHAMPEEHFGMAVAEMMRAGCIVFVPNGGGQVEIVGQHEQLLYHTGDEAVTKIVQVLKDLDRQRQLREYLDARKDFFSTEHFIRQFRPIVKNFSD